MTSALTDLLNESRQLGFLGPGPIEPHLIHASAFAAVVAEPPARALDLGAGGGLPGLVLAVTAWPETTWTFVDAQRKRTDFLRRAVQVLGLEPRVTVVTERAEEVARSADHRGRYDLVVARSFGAPAVVAECAAPLLHDGGWLVVSEPPAASTAPDGGDRWPQAGLASLGLGPAEIVLVDGLHPAHLARIPRLGPDDPRYPRRVGIPTKRPLF